MVSFTLVRSSEFNTGCRLELMMYACGQTRFMISWSTNSFDAEVLMLNPAKSSSSAMVAVPPVFTEAELAELDPVVVVEEEPLELLHAASRMAPIPTSVTATINRLLRVMHTPIVWPLRCGITHPSHGLRANRNAFVKVRGRAKSVVHGVSDDRNIGSPPAMQPVFPLLTCGVVSIHHGFGGASNDVESGFRPAMRNVAFA